MERRPGGATRSREAPTVSFLRANPGLSALFLSYHSSQPSNTVELAHQPCSLLTVASPSNLIVFPPPPQPSFSSLLFFLIPPLSTGSLSVFQAGSNLDWYWFCFLSTVIATVCRHGQPWPIISNPLWSGFSHNTLFFSQSLHFQDKSICANYFYVNLMQARVIREDEASIEKMPP